MKYDKIAEAYVSMVTTQPKTIINSTGRYNVGSFSDDDVKTDQMIKYKLSRSNTVDNISQAMSNYSGIRDKTSDDAILLKRHALSLLDSIYKHHGKDTASTVFAKNIKPRMNRPSDDIMPTYADASSDHAIDTLNKLIAHRTPESLADESHSEFLKDHHPEYDSAGDVLGSLHALTPNLSHIHGRAATRFIERTLDAIAETKGNDVADRVFRHLGNTRAWEDRGFQESYRLN